MSFELIFVIILLSLSSTDVFQSALGRVLYDTSFDPSAENVQEPEVIEIPEELLPTEDEDLKQEESIALENLSSKELQQLMTLSALAEALGEKSERLQDDSFGEGSQLPFNVEEGVPVLVMTPTENDDAQNPTRNEVLGNLADENDLLKKEIAILVSALEDSAKVIDSQDNEKVREHYMQSTLSKFLAAENMQQENNEIYEPIAYVTKELQFPKAQKRDDVSQSGSCEAKTRLTDGCSRLQTTFQLTMDEEATAACSAHQLCYACAFPLNEAMRGCDDIYVKQSNQMCDSEESESSISKCHLEADQLLQFMRLQHTKSAEVRASEIGDDELRGMCESSCAVSTMLLK